MGVRRKEEQGDKNMYC